MGKKITFEEFVERAEKCHGNGRYDYSMARDEYVDTNCKVTIKCNKCGIIFQQRPKVHIYQAGGCKKCANKLLSSTKTQPFSEFVKKALKIHGNKYNYEKSEQYYINSRSKIPIFCNDCKTIFFQRASNHLLGRGCFNCSVEKSKENRFWTLNEVKKAIISNGYITKKEVRTKNPVLYTAIIKHGYMNELNLKECTGNLKIKTIYSYHIFLNGKNYIYVGLTCNTSRRHFQHFNNYPKCSVGQFVEKNNLPIPNMIIEEEYLSEDIAKIKEGEYLNKYIKMGFIPINKAKTGAVGCCGRKKITISQIIERSKLYKSRKDFQINDNIYWKRAREYKIMDEIFPLKTKPRGYWKNKENILNEAKKCKNYADFMKCRGYDTAKKLGIIDQIKQIIPPKRKYYQV